MCTFKNRVQQRFKQLFSKSPEIAFGAPGRINIIGEHTDYNQGFVLPAAIDKKINFVFAKNEESGLVRIYALNADEYREFKLEDARPEAQGWVKYVMAITSRLLKNNEGFDVVFGGDLPIGSGMSSSSALTCGVAAGLNKLFGLNFPAIDLVKEVQEAEAIYTGVRGGIMDQFTIAMGKENQVILLDCQSLDYTYYPLTLGEYTLLLCNTGVHHELANSEYNTRRSECEKGVAVLQKIDDSIQSLRDADLAMINRYRHQLDPVIFNRCYFVVKENARVLESCKALQNSDLPTLGAFMYASHYGLQQEYKVSCRELDFLVDQTRNIPEILGARMMGGGFGGCTINLVRKDKVDLVVDQLTETYQKEFAIQMDAYQVKIGAGIF